MFLSLYKTLKKLDHMNYSVIGILIVNFVY